MNTGHTPLRTLVQVAVQLSESGASHEAEQLGEFVLPLVTVLHQRELQWGAVQQNELHVQHRFLLLHVIRHLRVPVQKKKRKKRQSERLHKVREPCKCKEAQRC